MGRACGTHRSEAECMQGFIRKVKRKETSRKTKTGGRIILKWIFEK
jgi:hypothetical protein